MASSITASMLGLPPSNASANDPLAASQAKRDQRFAELLAEDDEAKKALADITKGGAKGYWEWKIKQLRKQMTEQVMGEMQLTPEKLAAMTIEDRLKTLDAIEKAVSERLKLAMAEEMKRKEHTLLGFNATAQGILAAQEITSTS